MHAEVKGIGSTLTISGGVNFTAETVDVRGDVAGRDVVKSQTETITAKSSAVATGGVLRLMTAAALSNNTIHGNFDHQCR